MRYHATVERLEMTKGAVRDVVGPGPRISAPTRGVAIEDRWRGLRAQSLARVARLGDLVSAAHECGNDTRAAALLPGHHRWRGLHLTARSAALPLEEQIDQISALEDRWTAIAAEARAGSRDLEEALGGRSRPVAVARPAARPALTAGARELAA